jgi:hypothetical protein
MRSRVPWVTHSREWRNRQTRWIQVPVPERVWGFNSPLAHHTSVENAPRVGRDSDLTILELGLAR